MAPCLKTLERIVQSRLALLNQHGERSVSTHHILARDEANALCEAFYVPLLKALE